ncbi:FG-GAP-like repeat-containing protein [Mariprofundus sp. KV]|uniref:FG-GAP-like repeat-containing protein n=1 Tax=Mariprofundus sp. KV TaxID=2608715 RepID=UPI0015A48297|nr:FG-GAP-like repeat-containing protein [Mariprofundus sp. KV]NWF35524.1 hypothetical protein [Mariprofundus sp. KV]
MIVTKLATAAVKIKGNLFSLNPAIIQRHQLLNLIFLFLIGKVLLNFPISWLEIATILAFAICIDHLLIYIAHRKVEFFSYSAVNTALGVIFLLRATDLSIYILVVALAIAQKHWLRINGRHFLNPSNVAVVAGLLLFPYETYTTPEQWGGMWWLGAAMTLLGLLITMRVGRVLIPIAFTISYLILTYTFITKNPTEIMATLISGSFLLFIYFMLTDPRTTPDRPGYQILYATSIATLTILLELMLGARDITMFLALFIVSLFVPLMRIGQQKQSYIWQHLLAALATGIAVVAFSPLNTLNHLPTASAKIQHGTPSAAVPINPAATEKATWDQHPEWHEKSWDKPHLVSSPLTPQPRDHGFIRIGNALPELIPNVERKHFGFDFNYHAPVSAGDINHDGHLDLALATTGTSLTILINRGNGTFFDATAQLFDKIPHGSIDQIALADVDSDSYLDLILSFNPYEAGIAPPNRIYRFNPDSKHFEASTTFPSPVHATIGGYALIDINHDRFLDLYISIAHNWHKQENPPFAFMQSDGEPNQFWVSSADGWKEKKTDYFPQPDEKHASMTAMFTDLNNDGHPDFLLGNDLQPDLSYRMDGSGHFTLIPKQQIEYNAFNSMGYMGIDADNDGKLEIWENTISRDVLLRRTRYGELFTSAFNTLNGTVAVKNIERAFLNGEQNCNRFALPTDRALCEEILVGAHAKRSGNRKLCDSIVNMERRYFCRYRVNNPAYAIASPARFKRDVELFPRKVKKNILLKLDTEGRYRDVLGNDNAALTGWSWAAYPFDFDNNGFQDIFITTGMAIINGQEPSALLMNYSRPGTPSLINKASSYGVDFMDEGRGVIAADLDGDGDGDLVVMNLYTAPIFLENRFGGDAIKVELRSRHGNYYGIGSRVELHTSRGIQLREMAVGGVWDSMQPQQLHFGIADGESIAKLVIRWPYGGTTEYKGLSANHRYIIYD